MRLLSIKKLLPFALMMLFGTSAWAQPGVSVGKTATPAPPTATFHVWGDVKIDDVPNGGVEFLTIVPSSDPTNGTQVRRLAVPDTAKPGWGWIWDGTKWVMGPAGGRYVGKGAIEVIAGKNGAPDTIALKSTGAKKDDVWVWDGTKWVLQPGGGGRTYYGEDPIIIKGINKDTIALRGGNRNGDTFVWDSTAKKWTIGPGGNAGWALTGNNISNLNFIGTINNFPFIVKTTNTERMRVTPNGQVVINSATANGTDQFSSYAKAQGSVAVVGYANGLTATSVPAEGAGVVGAGNVYGIFGTAESTSEISYGVSGETYSSTANASGVFGAAGSGQGAVYGVWGQSDSKDGSSSGVMGIASATDATSSTFGVRGQTFSTEGGSAGVEGVSIGGRTSGVRGATLSEESFSTGVTGVSTGEGKKGGTYYGVWGLANKNCKLNTGIGVYGEGTSFGIVGRNTSTVGNCSGGYGIFADGDLGSSGVKTFHIDHPLDPANKYLNHISIESSEALNVYSGNITTNANGEATVKMPEYFQAINKDCRYTLTSMGQFANAIVLKKMENNQFVIKTDKPNVEVSWMVTGVRNDLYMQKYPVAAEVAKEDANKGKYLRPELYNQPAEKGIFYNPESAKPEVPQVAKSQKTVKTKINEKRR